jgi:DnaK suppressor protein
MNAKKLEKFKKLLLEKRLAIAGEVLQLRDSSFELGTDGTQDLGDDAANDSARQLSLRLSESERGTLRQIDEALERMDEGTFGHCEDCGDLIAPERLEALPYATLCVDCKGERERKP